MTVSRHPIRSSATDVLTHPDVGSGRAYTLPELPFDHADLEPHLSARILEIHHDRHHRAYVDGANAVTTQLDEARAAGDFSAITGLERTLAFNVSGHVLHSIQWTNLHPDGGERPGGRGMDGVGPTGELASAIDEFFGGFTPFRAHLTSVVSTIQGSGWGALTWEPLGRRLLIAQIHDHHANALQAGIPLLVIDAWEHAYYLQYENRRGEYADAIWNVVNWVDVADRFLAAMTTGSSRAE